MQEECVNQIDRLYRQEYGKMVSYLLNCFRLSHWQEAEDLVQDSFVAAYEKWPVQPPQNPRAWLYKVCRHKALNLLKRKNIVVDIPPVQETAKDTLFLPGEIPDHRLRLLFAACHPALSPRSQLIFALRTVGGFKTAEIAQALGMNQEAVNKSLKRSRHFLRENHIQQHLNSEDQLPSVVQLADRLPQVLLTIYLIFNAGYRSRREGGLLQQDLLSEAQYLCKCLLELPFPQADIKALYSLLLFHIARLPSIVSGIGELLDLESQDRKLWDKKIVSLGFRYLRQARGNNSLSRYHLEAGIAAIHCSAPSFQQTNWPAILRYYEALEKVNPSVFVQLGRTIAFAYAYSPAEAVQQLVALRNSFYEGYYLYHATLGKLYVLTDRPAMALLHYQQALKLSPSEEEKTFLAAKVRDLKVKHSH